MMNGFILFRVSLEICDHFLGIVFGWLVDDQQIFSRVKKVKRSLEDEIQSAEWSVTTCIQKISAFWN